MAQQLDQSGCEPRLASRITGGPLRTVHRQLGSAELQRNGNRFIGHRACRWTECGEGRRTPRGVLNGDHDGRTAETFGRRAAQNGRVDYRAAPLMVIAGIVAVALIFLTMATWIATRKRP